MPADRDELELVRDALERSGAVDSRRVQVIARGGQVVLLGAVASPEEADRAAGVAEEVGVSVVNLLRVDRGLREGAERPGPREQVEAGEGEVLLGGTDVLSGPESGITGDTARALEENAPLEPPDEPLFPPTRSEERGGAATRPLEAAGAGEAAEEAAEEGEPGPAAPDLTRQDLEAAARGHPLPALDPEAPAAPAEPRQEPGGVDELGRRPTAEAPPGAGFPEPLPQATPGEGVVGEGTAGGGATSGVPAAETGATGADTAAADPTRGGSGGAMETLGTHRGPEADPDRAVREDLPHRDEDEAQRE